MRVARLNPVPLLLLAFSALLTLCALSAGGPTEILGVLPALLLALALAFDFYPGEELIARLGARRSCPPRRSRFAVAPLPRPPAVWRPSGALLIAFGLAERPPPARSFALT